VDGIEVEDAYPTCLPSESFSLMTKALAPLVLPLDADIVNLPASGNTTLYVCEVVVITNELVAMTSKGKSIAEIGVGVGGGVGVLKLTLLPSLLLGLGLGTAGVGCCVGSGVGVGGVDVGGAAVVADGGFICELLFILSISGSDAYPVRKGIATIIVKIRPTIAILLWVSK